MVPLLYAINFWSCAFLFDSQCKIGYSSCKQVAKHTCAFLLFRWIQATKHFLFLFRKWHRPILCRYGQSRTFKCLVDSSTTLKLPALSVFAMHELLVDSRLWAAFYYLLHLHFLDLNRNSSRLFRFASALSHPIALWKTSFVCKLLNHPMLKTFAAWACIGA